MGQSVNNLQVRITEINDMLDDAYKDVQAVRGSADDNAAVLQNVALVRYEKLLKMLTMLTKSYDEARKADELIGDEEETVVIRGTSAPRKKKPRNLLEQLKQQEDKRTAGNARREA